MTRITRSMYHPDLQPAYFIGRSVTWMAKRRWGLRLMQRMMMRPLIGKQIDGVLNREIHIPSTATKNRSIRTRIYKPKNTTEPLPAMLYIHGGGYQMGVPEQAHPFYEDILKRRDVAVIAPAYGLSLAGEPYPAGLNDCYDVILWMKANASELAIRPDRFIIAGHSGGGGLTAALTLKIIDSQAADIAFQMPIYPMLDHRMQTPSAKTMVCTMVWDRDSNGLAWNNYLGHLSGEIPEYASPALRKDVSGLPPTISFVGDMEPFKDETIDYMNALKDAGVPTRFKLYKGGMHGFEVLAPKAPISLEANEFQLSAFEEFYDTYIGPSL